MPDLSVQLFAGGLYLPRYLAGADAPGLPFAQFAAFLGDEKAALSGQLFPRDDSARLGPDATSEDALQAIARQASRHRVVILNEAHVCSRHRHFLGEVARTLRPLGFDHLAMETLKNDGEAAFRQYESAVPEAGTYSWDPVLAETMRAALGLGYRFLAYEQRPDQKPADPQVAGGAIAARESAQAANLLAALTGLPKTSRLLVYVGYSHLRETPDARGNRWLGGRLRDAAVDPLTIEQSATGAFEPAGVSSQLAQDVAARFPGLRSVVATDDGRIVGAEPRGADLAVFHPPLSAVAGRPGWLAADGSRRLCRIDPNFKIDGPVLAQAMRIGEKSLVPADQYLLGPTSEKIVFFLRPGRYRLRLEEVGGHRLLHEFAAA